MEYIIITGTNPKKLIELVNDFIAQGWKLQGGVSSASVGLGNVLFYQAMIREKP